MLTAATWFHRFYMRYSLEDFHRQVGQVIRTLPVLPANYPRAGRRSFVHLPRHKN